MISNDRVLLPVAMNLVCLAIAMTLLVFYASGESANRVMRELVDGTVRDFSVLSALTFPFVNDAISLGKVQLWDSALEETRMAYEAQAEKHARERKAHNRRLERQSWMFLVLGLSAVTLIPSAGYALFRVDATLGPIGLLGSLVLTLMLFGTEFVFFYLVVRRWVVIRREELYVAFTDPFLKARGYDYARYCGSKADVDSQRHNTIIQFVRAIYSKFQR